MSPLSIQIDPQVRKLYLAALRLTNRTTVADWAFIPWAACMASETTPGPISDLLAEAAWVGFSTIEIPTKWERLLVAHLLCMQSRRSDFQPSSERALASVALADYESEPWLPVAVDLLARGASPIEAVAVHQPGSSLPSLLLVANSILHYATRTHKK